MQKRLSLEHVKCMRQLFESLSRMSSKCGPTNHLVSVSFIVGAESVGSQGPVGNAQLREKLPPLLRAFTIFNDFLVFCAAGG